MRITDPETGMFVDWETREIGREADRDGTLTAQETMAAFHRINIEAQAYGLDMPKVQPKEYYPKKLSPINELALQVNKAKGEA